MVNKSVEPLTTFDQPAANWQITLWREWCHAKDEEYAFYLFHLVNRTALGWKMVAVVTFLGAIAGGLVGYGLGAGLVNWGVNLGLWGPTLTPAFIMGWLVSLLGGVIGVWSSREFRSWYFWWQGQPPAAKVERALRHVRRVRPEVEELWGQPLDWAELGKARRPSPDRLVEDLTNRDWRIRFAARQALISLGGEAVDALKPLTEDNENPLWQVAMWILTSIEQDTANRFAWRLSEIYCPSCLALFQRQPVNLALGISFSYCGCRVCHQSQKFISVPQGSVAVLDAAWKEVQTLEEGLLRVNWLLRRDLFDFDRVEILRATDEEVERFAVQVGNDTDPFRRPRYKQVTCLIDPRCHLSENTRRILRRTFGQVIEPNLKPLRQKTHDRLATNQRLESSESNS